MKHTRRDFLRNATGALTMTALFSGLGRFSLTSALAQSGGASDYKALVCIFLFGGNDGNNTIIPYEQNAYNQYSSVRGGLSTDGGLAIPRDTLLPITPANAAGQYGLHPSLSDLHPLFAEGKLAMLCNVGTLVQPLTRAQYLNPVGVKRPESLFSHSDQQEQWQTSLSIGDSATGWGGRLADKTNPLNGAATFPMVVSISGTNLFITGADSRPITVPSSGTFGLSGFGTDATSQARYNAMRQLLTVDTDGTMVRGASRTTEEAIVNSQLLTTALNSAPATTTQFPTTSIGKQLQQVAKIIASRNTLGLKRQLFFCSLGGFDTHNGQIAQQQNLFGQLGLALRRFYDATVELGVSSNVTSFTLSDFGRTLKPASGGGSDHAWGSHHMIVGGAVRGGNLYGTFPTLAFGGPDDSGTEGRWIPTTAVDQYAATLASWYGLSNTDMSLVFPNIGRFATPNLGFLA